MVTRAERTKLRTFTFSSFGRTGSRIIRPTNCMKYSIDSNLMNFCKKLLTVTEHRTLKFPTDTYLNTSIFMFILRKNIRRRHATPNKIYTVIMLHINSVQLQKSTLSMGSMIMFKIWQYAFWTKNKNKCVSSKCDHEQFLYVGSACYKQ